MNSIALEAVDAGNVDDVVVRYDDAPNEFTQVRFAVNLATPLDTPYLCSTSTAAGTSMLQKFYASWISLRGDAAPWMQLITNRAPAHDDPLLSQVDGLSCLLVPAIQRDGPRSAIGEQRAIWAEHLGIEEDELFAMLECIRFRLGRQYDAEYEHAGDLMLSAGMRNDATAIRLGVDLIGRWIIEGRGRRQLSASEVRASVEALGLHMTDAAPTLLIQAIDHDPHPEDADMELDWVHHFEQADPRERRLVVTTDGYPTMHEELRDAAARLLATGYRHIVVRGPMRLATWFAAGAALPETRGVRLTCGHPGQPWSTDAGPGVALTLDAVPVELGLGTELGVALAFAADPLDDVVAFARKTELPLDRVVRLSLPDGRRIADGAEAVSVAQAVKGAVRRALRETGSSRVHLFQAGPAGLSLLLGHRWNRVAPTVVWEDVGVRGYQRAFDVPA